MLYINTSHPPNRLKTTANLCFPHGFWELDAFEIACFQVSHVLKSEGGWGEGLRVTEHHFPHTTS